MTILNSAVKTTALFTLCTLSLTLFAHEYDNARPDSHAPIGVTGDHLHQQGEWMVEYRYMYMRMDELRQGSDSISNQDAFQEGYDMVPNQMTMQMNMFMLMYAPSDSVTLMGMAMYNSSEMSMTTNPHSESMGGHGDMHGHDHSSGGSHETSGWGDTVVSALVKLWQQGSHQLHAEIGFGLPTANVEEKMDGVYQAYGMQLGTGIWDFRPGLTYTSQADSMSWGAQIKAAIALEDENDAGFRFGNAYEGTMWIAKPLAQAWSVSGRLTYEKQESISGHYNGPHPHAAPNHFQQNYGGERSFAALGANLRIPEGKLKGQRFGAELSAPIYENLNGIQLGVDYNFTIGWQFAW
ncbi:transporter [Kiritimatiellota bacterium B12222]|nr:transporter [Kiritimatiellota bacterium B12222]